MHVIGFSSKTQLDKQAQLQEIRKLMTIDNNVSTAPIVDEQLLAVLLAQKRELSDEEITELVQKIRPVVCDESGRYFYIKPVDPREESFIWDPTLTDEAVGEMGSIARVATIYTLHEYGAPSFFKPSIAEVLSMIPQHLLGKITAFETISPDSPEGQWPALKEGYHVAVTHLYA
jgi:hypothetical protein